jgi:nucleotide-binding universal stress UspA family protein
MGQDTWHTQRRTVVVGVADGNHPAVLDYARCEAERTGTGLTLVHAYSVPPSAMGWMYGLDIPEAYRAGGHDVLVEAVRRLTRDGLTSRIDTVLIRGFAPAVLESASRSGWVVVIGTDGSKPWFLRLTEGSVARRLVERADCPVVVVPDGWTTARASSPVVAMVDDVDTAYAPLAYAFEAATARRADLQVLHVADPRDRRSDDDWLVVRRVVDAWFDRHPDVLGSCRQVEGEPYPAALAAAHGAGLLVLGRPRDRHLPSLLVQSLAQEIIAVSECPVAVTPNGYRGTGQSAA